MFFRVNWEETLSYELVVEATSEEAAIDLVLDGKYNSDDVSENCIFDSRDIKAVKLYPRLKKVK